MFPTQAAGMIIKLIATVLLLSFIAAQEGLYPPNFEASEELFVQLPTTNISLCYQTIGNPKDPALLLIAGLGSSMMMFTPQLLSLLSPPEDPHYIVRFDLRDTGRSTAFPLNVDGAPPRYLLQNMADDIVGLIDHIGAPIHLAGFSMGGPLAFMTAAQRPHLVKSLFLALTSPVGFESSAADNLPPIRSIDPELLSNLHLPALASPKQDWIDFLVASQLLLYTQPPWEIEVSELRIIAELTYERGFTNGTLMSNANHIGAVTYGGRWPRELLRDIQCPALVVSAELDQTFDPAHGRALAADLPNGEFTLYRESGHEIPRRIWGDLSRDMLWTMTRGQRWWSGKKQRLK
jgi:pimeloyl-ACP methyl ester carboxylesterase